jgi:hypothetical protein
MLVVEGCRLALERKGMCITVELGRGSNVRLMGMGNVLFFGIKLLAIENSKVLDRAFVSAQSLDV